MEPLILYVDDERPNLDLFRRSFDDELPVFTASSAREGLDVLSREEVGVLISDHRMPEMTGIDLLAEAARRWPHVSRILLTAYSDRELLLAAIREGHVHDYVLKPWDADDLRLRLRRAIDDYRGRSALVEAAQERDALREELGLDGPLVGLDGGLAALAPILTRVAQAHQPVVIVGEPGSGRRTIAHTLHASGPRAAGPFVALRAGRGDLEAQLVGGPGAPGALARARGGTLYLADLDLLTDAPQRRLATVLRELRDPERVRIVSSSTRPLEGEVRAGRFSSELYTLMQVLRIDLPPLRARPTDVAALAQQILAAQVARLGKPLTLSSEAVEALARYDWPGNVRELRNVIERAAVLADPGARLEAEDFLFELSTPRDPAAPAPAPAAGGSIYDEISKEEGDRLRAALKQAAGNKARAARLLGIARTTLNDRLKRYGVE